ncbi:hypothetical protein AAVH_16705 [Aphelenchoides avenae]|nr:hypothetical protein AAVH_16705 [Aphelenchus avenae]
MVFHLNGTERAVPAKEYTRQAPGDTKTCVLLLQDVSTAQGQFGSLLLPPLYAMNNYWVLGSSFLRGSCQQC